MTELSDLSRRNDDLMSSKDEDLAVIRDLEAQVKEYKRKYEQAKTELRSGAVAEFDGYRAGILMVERCRTPELAIDTETFALRMQHIVLNVKRKTFSLGQIKISDILKEVLKAVRKHHVKMEGDFVNTVISILLLEGIGRQLDPGLDLFKSALPILRQLGRQMSTQENMKQLPSGEVGAFLKVRILYW